MASFSEFVNENEIGEFGDSLPLLWTREGNVIYSVPFKCQKETSSFWNVCI